MAIHERKQIVITPFLSSSSGELSSWELIITKDGDDTLRFALHWSGKEIPTHTADESFAEFCQKVVAL